MDNYELNKEKNDVINISKYKNCLSNEEEWIRDESFVSGTILYNNIDQEIKYLLTYENEWLESFSNSLNT